MKVCSLKEEISQKLITLCVEHQTEVDYVKKELKALTINTVHYERTYCIVRSKSAKIRAVSKFYKEEINYY
jgi:hypothetical protein